MMILVAIYKNKLLCCCPSWREREREQRAAAHFEDPIWLLSAKPPDNPYRKVFASQITNQSASSFITINAGVLGLKSFMCPLGINDFPMTKADRIKEGLSILAKYRRLLLVHAEIQRELEGIADDPRSYSTYFKTWLASF
ncbi:hypothetical protein ACSBR1_009837 [Camellia fascicularis]